MRGNGVEDGVAARRKPLLAQRDEDAFAAFDRSHEAKNRSSPILSTDRERSVRMVLR